MFSSPQKVVWPPPTNLVQVISMLMLLLLLILKNVGDKTDLIPNQEVKGMIP